MGVRGSDPEFSCSFVGQIGGQSLRSAVFLQFRGSNRGSDSDPQFSYDFVGRIGDQRLRSAFFQSFPAVSWIRSGVRGSVESLSESFRRIGQSNRSVESFNESLSRIVQLSSSAIRSLDSLSSAIRSLDSLSRFSTSGPRKGAYAHLVYIYMPI